MTHQIDAIDRKILDALQRDASLTNAQLAERINLSPTPCLRRVRRLEKEGIIQGYTARLDGKALGIGIAAFVFVKLDRHSVQNAKQFENKVQKLPQITECCVISGDYDYVLRIVARDLESYEHFMKEKLAQIEGIRDASSTIILSQQISPSKIPLYI